MAEKSLRNKQFVNTFLTKLERFETYVDEDLNTAKLRSIQLRLNDIVASYASFQKCLPPFEKVDEKDISAETIERIEDLYYDIRPAFEDRIAELLKEAEPKQDQLVAPVNQLNLNFKLPEISLDVFSGDYIQWKSFIGSFDSIIHSSKSLSTLAKFQYLKKSLRGSALQVIESLDFIDENYEVARKLLSERFDKKFFICEQHISALFSFKSIDRPCPNKILEIIDHFKSHLRSLQSLERPVDKWDDLIVHLMLSKLDSETKSRWIENAPVQHFPTFEDLCNYLRTRARQLESIPKQNAKNSPPKLVVVPKSQKTFTQANKTSLTVASKPAKTVYNCLHCHKLGHTIVRCHKFLSLPCSERQKFVIEAKLCSNCLRSHYDNDTCPVEERCKHCNDMHHSLLHNSSISKEPPKDSVQTASSASISSSARSVAPTAKFVYLATALVNVLDITGQAVVARALLDSGSQINAVTASFLAKLQLPSSSSKTTIHGIGINTTSSLSTAQIKLMSRETTFSTELKVHVLPKITDYQPTYEVNNIESWPIPTNINLADPDFFKRNSIDLLLGAEIYYDLLSVGQIKMNKKLPILQNTLLGWIVAGNYELYQPPITVCHVASESETDLSAQIEKFWIVEDAPRISNSKSVEEDECEKHFVENTIRDGDGRFVVRLPFSNDPSALGNSKFMALRRFRYLEQKLAKSPELMSSYSSFIDEYKALGHMKLVHSDEISTPNFYFPHHAVLKPDSSSTKLRVVFDGSAKSSSGKSLNNLLRVGPTVQSDLFSILLRFRSHKYAFSGDITKMYRQVRVHDDDQSFQLILWRDSPGEEIKTYKLTTVTYGTSCAPFLATRCVNQLAQENATEFPAASESMLRDIYVDDLLTGATTIEEAQHLRADIEKILSSAGMDLKKWCSNCSEVIEDVPMDHRETFLKINDDDLVKTLGVLWQPTADIFTFSINITKSSIVSKRSIFSQVARIFDPLGLLSPVVVLGKLLIQSLWQLQLDWDESLPQNLHTQWIIYRDSLHQLNQFSIKRYAFASSNLSFIEIHGFCDASERAYGAVIYVRSISIEGEVTTRLLCSKSRVAPLKTISLPRLELCAASLLANLMNSAVSIINCKPDRVFYWSDSTITLHWIKNTPSRWETFVANRVSTIHELSSPDCWNHVPTALNPADLVSRGVVPEKLVHNVFWTNGPDFLKTHPDFWPTQDFDFKRSTSEEALVSVGVADVHSTEDIFALIGTNDFQKLQRVIAYMLRWKPIPRYRGPISHEELSRAHNTIIRHVQSFTFPDEIKNLSKPNNIIKNPSLKSLNLFLDSENIIRVGGRLEHSSLPYESKHQILLPSNHDFTLAVLLYYHIKLLHAGPQSLLAAVREFYWPINGRKLCTKIFRHCIRCFKVRPTSVPQQMGNLPQERVTVAPPFHSVAVDYCGPFFIHYKIRGKQPTKTYLCVFVCLVTKAVHLELSSDLSSAAFLGCLKRFVATRGVPHTILSDNATNFVGANSALTELYEMFSSGQIKDELDDYLLEHKILWKFTPPNSPNFGGLHEAAVKLAKFHLLRIIVNTKLTYEQLHTVVKEVEAILNSRPITALSNNPNDLECLTPGHFLIGRRLTSLPTPNLQPKPPLDTWQVISHIKAHFWNRWSVEYIRSQQQRHQWTEKTDNIRVNDLVLLVDDNSPPMRWKLGRVTETFPGSDGLVRVVMVKTATAEYKRGVTKVCKLPSSVESGITFQPREDDHT